MTVAQDDVQVFTRSRHQNVRLHSPCKAGSKCTGRIGGVEMGERVHIDPCLAPAIFSWYPIMIGCTDRYAIDGFGRRQKATIGNNVSEGSDDGFCSCFGVGVLECGAITECRNGKVVGKVASAYHKKNAIPIS